MNQSSSHYLRTALIGAAALLLALLLLVLILDLGVFKSRIESSASRLLAREVTIDGNLSIRVGRNIRIAAESLQVAAPDWATEAELLKVDQLEATVSVASIIDAIRNTGPVLVTGVRLNGARIALEESGDGRRNWTLGSGDRKETPRETTPEAASPSIPVLLDDTVITDFVALHRSPATPEPQRLVISRMTQRFENDQILTRLDGAINDEAIALALVGQPVAEILALSSASITLEGNVGEILLSAEVYLPDLLAPTRPEVELSLEGPSFEYLTKLLGLPEISKGPLKVDASVSAFQQQMQFTLDGRAGEYLVRGSGQFDDLSSLEYATLSLSASGPNARNVTDLMGIPALPALPFSIESTLIRDGFQVDMPSSRLTIGRLQLDASGNASDFRKPSSATAELALAIPSVEPFVTSLKLPEGLAGELTAAVNLTGRTNGANVSGTVKTQYGTTQFSGLLTDAEALAGSELQIDAALPGLPSLLGTLGITLDEPQAGAFQADISLHPERISINEATAGLGDNTVEIEGDVFPDDRRVSLTLRGQNIGAWLPENTLKSPLPSAFAAQADLTLLEDAADIENFELRIGEARVAGEATAALDGSSLVIQLTGNAPDAQPFVLAATGKALTEPTPIDFRTRAAWRDDTLSLTELHLGFARGRIAADGVVRGAPVFDGTDLNLDVFVDDLSRLSPVLGTALPRQSLSIAGRAIGSPRVLSIPAMKVRSGDTDFAASAVIDYREKPNFDLNINGPHIDLQPFLAAGSDAKAPDTDAAPRDPDGRLIPDVALDISPLNDFDGDLNLNVDALSLSAKQLTNFELRAAVSDGELDIPRVAYRGERGGQGKARAHVAPSDSGARLLVDVEGTEIALGLFAKTPEEAALRPRYQVDTALVGEGRTLRELLGGMEGYIRVDGSAGKIASGALSNFTNDFLSSLLEALNPVRQKREYEAVSCVALMAVIEDGKLAADPAVVFDTDQLNITASARVDLDTEALKVNFRTVPKKGAGIGISNLINPFIQVSGTLAKPRLNLDAKNVIIEGGKQVATGGMLFLAETVFNRIALSDQPCQEALTEADKQFDQLRARYDAIER